MTVAEDRPVSCWKGAPRYACVGDDASGPGDRVGGWVGDLWVVGGCIALHMDHMEKSTLPACDHSTMSFQ